MNIETKPVRGILLSGFLLLSAALSIYGLVSNGQLLFSLSGDPNFWFLANVVALSAVRLVAVSLIWFWRLWVFYLFAACTAITVVLGLLAGVPWFTSVLGVLGVVILYLLLRPVWRYLS